MIPTPRPSATLTRIHGRHLSAYLAALDEMKRWANVKDRRSNVLRAHYERQRKDAVTVAYLIDKDQEVCEAQIMLERATAHAAALGPAAILESQGMIT